MCDGVSTGSGAYDSGRWELLDTVTWKDDDDDECDDDDDDDGDDDNDDDGDGDGGGDMVLVTL